MEEGDSDFLSLALLWLPHRHGSGSCHAWPGQRAAREGRRHGGSYPGGFLHREQTFVHREETLAQDVAAAPELHPEPAVCGDEGLRGFIAAKPAWEVEEKVRLRPQGGARGTRRAVLQMLKVIKNPTQATRPGARPGLTDGKKQSPSLCAFFRLSSGELQAPINQSAQSIAQALFSPAKRGLQSEVLKVWRDNGLRRW